MLPYNRYVTLLQRSVYVWAKGHSLFIAKPYCIRCEGS